ncbi:MAG TPA: helix-turn-helix domain-containing protein [Chloroflexota bacterium]|nr:helix-turn-helix domain-containing protein [Chloroflexota bacterium]
MEETTDLLTSTQAAALAGISAQAIWQAARMGRLPHEQTKDPTYRRSGGGATLLFRRADVEAYMAQTAATRARRGHALTNAERQRRKYAKKKAESS